MEKKQTRHCANNVSPAIGESHLSRAVLFPGGGNVPDPKYLPVNMPGTLAHFTATTRAPVQLTIEPKFNNSSSSSSSSRDGARPSARALAVEHGPLAGRLEFGPANEEPDDGPVDHLDGIRRDTTVFLCLDLLLLVIRQYAANPRRCQSTSRPRRLRIPGLPCPYASGGKYRRH
jgi:hypothetical protein